LARFNRLGLIPRSLLSLRNGQSKVRHSRMF
jgi:hypothetical protein